MVLINLRTNKRIESDTVLTDCILQDSPDGQRWMQRLSVSQSRVIDVDSLSVTIEEYQLQEDGTRYKYYLPDMVDGVYVPDIAKIVEDSINSIVLHGEALVKQHIQKPIDDYNLANSIRIENINNCMLYKDDANYPHQQFCIDMIAFNIAVWDKARQVQVDMLNMDPLPTDEEFLALLPVFGV